MHCFGFVLADYTHIFQGYFTDAKTIIKQQNRVQQKLSCAYFIR